MLGVTNATPMDIFQDNTQGWNNHLNAMVHIFKEQMDMILEARNDIAQCQHIIVQQNTQIANLQLQAQAQGVLCLAWVRTSVDLVGSVENHGIRSSELLFHNHGSRLIT